MQLWKLSQLSRIQLAAGCQVCTDPAAELLHLLLAILLVSRLLHPESLQHLLCSQQLLLCSLRVTQLQQRHALDRMNHSQLRVMAAQMGCTLGLYVLQPCTTYPFNCGQQLQGVGCGACSDSDLLSQLSAGTCWI